MPTPRLPLVALAALIAAGACASPPPSARAVALPGSAARYLPLRDTTERHRLGFVLTPGAAVLALGDTLRLAPARCVARGESGTCAPGAVADVRWRVTDPAVVSVNDAGVLCARGIGRATVSAQSAAWRGDLDVTVLPPIASLRWTPRARAVAVGESIEMAVVARDSAGRVVRVDAPITVRYPEGVPTVDVTTGGTANEVRIRARHVGTAEVIAHLGPRADTVRLQVLRRLR